MSGRPKTNFTAGFKIIIDTADGRRTVYRKGKCESVAISNAEYISGFIRMIECHPLTATQWALKS